MLEFHTFPPIATSKVLIVDDNQVVFINEGEVQMREEALGSSSSAKIYAGDAILQPHSMESSMVNYG